MLDKQYNGFKGVDLFLALLLGLKKYNVDLIINWRHLNVLSRHVKAAQEEAEDKSDLRAILKAGVERYIHDAFI